MLKIKDIFNFIFLPFGVMKYHFKNWIDAINRLKDEYEKKGGFWIMKNGSLLDEYCFYGDGLKYTVLTEKYLNERSSYYFKRQFKKLPKKYEKYFFQDDDEEILPF